LILTNILYRTFFIKALEYGTAFTVDVAGKEFLVTARHLLPASGDEVEIKLFHSKTWKTLSAKVVGRGRGEIDVAVLHLPAKLTETGFPVNPTIGGLTLGHEVFFTGFPHKMSGDVGSFMGGLPCPFAKKGMLALLDTGSPQVLYVDAINNEGFSGGPLFFYPNPGSLDLRIAGVVSKFKVEYETVLDEFGEPTRLRVPYNTGFLVAYGIKHVLDLIEQHASA
jgi:hypothetical protein